MHKKFEKLLEKEKVQDTLDLIKKILLSTKKPDEDDVNAALQGTNKLIELIKKRGWPFPRELAQTIHRAMVYRLTWRQRQELIHILALITQKFPKELFTDIELADEIIAALKERIEKDEDDDNKFTAVIVLGDIGLLFPDKTIDYLRTCLKNPSKSIKMNAIRGLKEIAKRFDQTHVKLILPFLTEVLQNDQEEPMVMQQTIEAIHEINEAMFKDEVSMVFATIQVPCPYCDDFYPQESPVCTSCGKPAPKCLICGKKVDLIETQAYKKCDQCISFFHNECLEEWRQRSRVCPHCLVRLP